MSPEVVAAIIAASVSFLTLIGTLAAQYFGRRATSNQLEKTLAEQRTRTLNERFTTAAEQLGSDKPAVRLAGVYAMAGLADDWDENRQTCVDVLCGYLRMRYEPDPGQDAPEPQRIAFQAAREVRHTVIRIITAHLREHAAPSWQRLDFDFTGVVFDGGDFRRARFSGGTVSFSDARFSGGKVDFSDARFSRGKVDFQYARFSGGTVSFNGAQFSGGSVFFHYARFDGGTVSFVRARFSGGLVDFEDAQFSDGTVRFGWAQFLGNTVDFVGARFSGCTVDFDRANFFGTVSFFGARFSGGTVDFVGAGIPGGTLDFSDAGDWSFPPAFSWTDTPPASVKLPKLA